MNSMMRNFFFFIFLHFISASIPPSNIIITNHPDTQEWWVALYISNVDLSCGGTITNVEIWYNNDWFPFTKYEWRYYSFEHTGNAFTTPFSVRITKTNGAATDKITGTNTITSFTGYHTFVLGSNFCSSSSSGSSLADYVGFDLSIGLQSSPLSSTQISAITSTLTGVRNYKFYGWSQDYDIAKAILSSSSDANNIKFYIEIIPSLVNNLQISDIESLLTIWDDISDHISVIALGNEPLLNGLTFSILPSKLRMVCSYLSTRSGWEHVKVSIPFSQNIFASTYPVQDSSFKTEYRSYLIEIMNILQEYDGPFSINIYPFFVLSDPNNLYLLDYCLGNEGAVGSGEYSAMIEAQYDATYYAMNNAVSNNNVEIMMTETGWSSSSASLSYATISNANDYIVNTLNLMNTPSSPLYGKTIYFFELFDEDLKGGGDHEQHFGFYHTNTNTKYTGLDLLY